VNASIDAAPWLHEAGLARLLEVLNADGEEARIAGGAVRDALLGRIVSDVDIATTNLPAETSRRAANAGFKTVPTGIEHGTITVIADGRPVEVTTLRADVETDGRRAKVVFGRDWKGDAERRDFTINALYAGADGAVIDLVGGLADLEARRLRFIGDAEQRIREDYLRILRFFRFFAWFGAGRPDAEGLKACARLKEGLDGLSAERIWSELKKLMNAPDPSRALLWMRQAGVLSRVLPESEKWGIDAIHGLTVTERDLAWAPDAILRIEAIVPPDEVRMVELARRLKLSKQEAARLAGWAAVPAASAGTSDAALRKQLYLGAPQATIDRLKLALAGARSKAGTDDDALMQAAGFSRQLKVAEGWKAPKFPIKGADIGGMGIPEGPGIGRVLQKLEKMWIDSGFAMTRSVLLEHAAKLIKS
jgi:poly(A) polymerase